MPGMNGLSLIEAGKKLHPKMPVVLMSGMPVARHPAKNVRRQMGNTNLREDQRASVICQETDVAPPCFRAPPDVAIPAAEVAWAELHARQAMSRRCVQPKNFRC